MSAWGPAIFSSDTACDVRGTYEDMLCYGHTPEEAEAQTMKEMEMDRLHPEDDPDAWLALAATEWRCGRKLSDDVRAIAMALIDQPIPTDLWKTEKLRLSRRKALDKLRDQLNSPLPKPKRLRPLPTLHSPWQVGDVIAVKLPEKEELATEDKWILTAFNRTVKSVRQSLDHYEIGVALSNLYDFLWDVFCDWYIELSKASLSEKDTHQNLVTQNVIAFVLVGTLKLLHPFMPFITEEIYQSLPHEAESIMIDRYPEPDEALDFSGEAAHMERLIAVIRAIRARRNEMNVPPARKAHIYLATAYPESFGPETEPFFRRLAFASGLQVADSFDPAVISADSAVQIVTDSATVLLPLADIIDTEKEKARLSAELTKLEEDIRRAEAKLSNENFVSRAPAAVVNGERAKLQKLKENQKGVADALQKLN